MGEPPITHAQLAAQASYLAKEACAWAGDLVSPLPRWGDPVRPETVARFLAAIRERLDLIEHWSATPASGAAGTEERDGLR